MKPLAIICILCIGSIHTCTHICAQIGHKHYFFRCSANKEFWLLTTSLVLERMTSQLVRYRPYVCYDGSSKQNGRGQASILQRHLGSDTLIWPKRSYLLAESFTFCGRNVHEIRDDSAKNCGRNGSWPKRPVTV